MIASAFKDILPTFDGTTQDEVRGLITFRNGSTWHFMRSQDRSPWESFAPGWSAMPDSYGGIGDPEVL